MRILYTSGNTKQNQHSRPTHLHSGPIIIQNRQKASCSTIQTKKWLIALFFQVSAHCELCVWFCHDQLLFGQEEGRRLLFDDLRQSEKDRQFSFHSNTFHSLDKKMNYLRQELTKS